jgi:DNA-binding transcriptional LysR family regulator
VVAFDDPCALRTRALETLSGHSIPVIIHAEAMQLAGVHAAVIAGLGVALMATLDQTPEGLEARDELPRADPIPLAMWCCRKSPGSGSGPRRWALPWLQRPGTARDLVSAMRGTRAAGLIT